MRTFVVCFEGACFEGACPGEDEHVQNEVHALLICQDH
jgi:hypothetical protein